MKKTTFGYKQTLVASILNERFGDFFGGSILSGFRLAKGTGNYTVSLVRENFLDSLAFTYDGVRIQETEDVIDALFVDPNTSASVRYDVVYAAWTLTGEVTSFSYLLIKGVPGLPADIQKNPKNRVALGYVRVRQNATIAPTDLFSFETGARVGKIYADAAIVDGTPVLTKSYVDGAIQLNSDRLTVVENELSGGRKTFESIDARINGELSLKANILDVEARLALLGSASPKGVYATLAELTADKSSGDTGIYIVSGNGKWYFWNGTAWAEGGTYQATAIGDNSIAGEKIMADAVSPESTTFMKKSTNIVPFESGLSGYSIDGATGLPVVSATNIVSDFVRGIAGQSYSMDKITRWYAYTANKTPISGGTTTPFTAPAGTFYLRFSASIINSRTAMVNVGSTILAYEEYRQEFKSGIGLVVQPSFNTVQENAMQEDSVTALAMVPFKKPTNLFNKGNVQVDTSLSSTSGLPIAGAGRHLTGFIKIKPNTLYSKYLDASFVVAFYDKNKNFISYTVHGTSVSSFTTPQNAYYMRGSIVTSRLDVFQFNVGASLLPYEPHVYEFRSTPEFPLKIAPNIQGINALTETRVTEMIETRMKPFKSLNYTKLTYANLVASLSSTGCVVEQLGMSSDGVNRLYAIRYGDTTTKPVILIGAGAHGNEWKSCYYTVDFMKRISGALPFYDTTLRNNLRTAFAFYAIVCVNPSGYINDTVTNANNVNLNHNWDQNWTSFNDSGTDRFKGSAPFSEAETLIYRDKITELKPYMLIDAHTTDSAGGIDTGLYYTDYRTILSATDKEVYAMFNDADLNVQEYNIGANPSAVGWGGKQNNKDGLKVIPTIIEHPNTHPGNYGLTMLVALAVRAYKKLYSV